MRFCLVQIRFRTERDCKKRLSICPILFVSKKDRREGVFAFFVSSGLRKTGSDFKNVFELPHFFQQKKTDRKECPRFFLLVQVKTSTWNGSN